MKPSMIALIAALTLCALPATAMNFDLGSLTPSLDFPAPESDTVAKDVSDISE